MRRFGSSLLLLVLLAPAAHAAPNADADRAIAATKPELGESPEMAEAKCLRLSDEARARGARVLVIAFEGLASFSAASTQQAYRYLWELNHGLEATPPGVAINGFVVRGTLRPLIAKYHS